MNDTVRALCGAGQVASILQQTKRDTPVFCLGSWANTDDGLVQALVCGNGRRDNPLHLKLPFDEIVFTGEGAVPKHVFNLGTADSGTNRVIRIYRRASLKEYRLVERIDFATAPSVKEVELPPNVDDIVVKDHGHGIVTSSLIRRLAKTYPAANWYIATKRWDVLEQSPRADDEDETACEEEWLTVLAKLGCAVKLILFQHEAAAAAKTTDDAVFPEVGNWFVEQKAPTQKALSAIDSILDRFNAIELAAKHSMTEPAIVILPTRDSILARFPGESAPRGHMIVEEVKKGYQALVPRASAFFAALCFQHWTKTSAGWPANTLEALRFTNAWDDAEGKRIFERGGHSNNVTLESKLDAPLANAMDFDWRLVRSEYRQALTAWPRLPTDPGMGVIRRNDEHRLELWRAMSDADGVISIIRAKRRVLGHLSREFDEFLHDRPDRRTSKSFLIVDDPGGGKSTLVKKLADSRNMRILMVNITELTRRVDLLGFFDTIVTTQAQNPDTPLLIFVDEINALLEGHTVYSSFLAPLEDGHYNRDGKSFNIRPCIWVFVGTDDITADRSRKAARSDGYSLHQLTEDVRSAFAGNQPEQAPAAKKAAEDTDERMEQQHVDRAHKKSDFVSRLTLPPFILNRPFSRVVGETQLEEAAITIADSLAALPTSDERPPEVPHQQETLDEMMRALAQEQDKSYRQRALRMLRRRLLREGHALERVYIAVKIITDRRPNIQKISLRVLRAFAHMPDSYSLRDLRHDLDRLVNVRDENIVWNNLPEAFRQRHGFVRLAEGRLLAKGEQSFGCRVPLAELWPTNDAVMVTIRPSLAHGDQEWKKLPPPGSRPANTD